MRTRTSASFEDMEDFARSVVVETVGGEEYGNTLSDHEW